MENIRLVIVNPLTDVYDGLMDEIESEDLRRHLWNQLSISGEFTIWNQLLVQTVESVKEQANAPR